MHLFRFSDTISGNIILFNQTIFRAKVATDRVGIMKEGKWVMVGTRKDFLKEDLEKNYLDYMQETLRVLFPNQI